MADSGRRQRPVFLARLDEGPPAHRDSVLLIGVGVALVWFWLPAIAFVFVRTVVEGQRTAPPSHPGLILLLRPLLANGLVAFAVGALAGSAVGRFRWAIGPAPLVAVAAYNALAAMSVGQQGLTIPGPGGPVHVRAELHPYPSVLVWMLCLLACAALGGHLAPRLSRRLPLRLAVTGALGWVWIAFVAALIEGIWSSRYHNMPYSQWSMADLALKAPRVLPYVLGGAWMRWATRAARPWAGAVIVGSAAAMQAFRGYVDIASNGSLSALLLYGSWCLQPVVWAALGAWAGGLVLGLGSRMGHTKEAAVVVVAGAIAAAIGLLASSTQVGIPAP